MTTCKLANDLEFRSVFLKGQFYLKLRVKFEVIFLLEFFHRGEQNFNFELNM